VRWCHVTTWSTIALALLGIHVLGICILIYLAPMGAGCK
jgi:hypothetical protein